MSSTLFARGVNTQTGMRKRAEDVAKSIADVTEAVRGFPDEFLQLRAQILVLEKTVETLTKKVLVLEQKESEREKKVAT
jgi:septal ring factor EnvC (AmiA/AmiB activator)